MVLARYLLQCVGLHPGQELLLMHLWDAGPQRQADLASEFGTDSASMTRTVQRLEESGSPGTSKNSRTDAGSLDPANGLDVFGNLY